jgi:hypothetical protein
MSIARPQDLRIEHPDVAFELETAALEFEMLNELFYQGCIRTWEKGASITIELSGNHSLIVTPMVRSYGGYPVWGRVIDAFNPQTGQTVKRQVLHVHVMLREGSSTDNLVEFELQASSLERIAVKALAQIQQICSKRLVVQLVEDIYPN